MGAVAVLRGVYIEKPGKEPRLLAPNAGWCSCSKGRLWGRRLRGPSAPACHNSTTPLLCKWTSVSPCPLSILLLWLHGLEGCHHRTSTDSTAYQSSFTIYQGIPALLYTGPVQPCCMPSSCEKVSTHCHQGGPSIFTDCCYNPGIWWEDLWTTRINICPPLYPVKYFQCYLQILTAQYVALHTEL